MDYNAVCRSSYFKVKDADAFEKWCKELDLTSITQENDEHGKLYGFMSEYSSGFPNVRSTEDGEELDIDFIAELAGHLEKGWIAVLQEIGREGMRYFVGVSIAVFWNGEYEHRSIEDIYEYLDSKYCQLKGHYTECQY